MTDDRTTASAAIIADGLEDKHSDRAFIVAYDQGENPRTRVVPLTDDSVVTIGRLSTNTLPIDHDSVSRYHARIRRKGGEILVEDLESRNGTRVNGNPIDGPTLLTTGDEINIGPMTAIVGVTSTVRKQMLIGSSGDLDERLGAECDRAIRYHRPLGIAMLRIDGNPEAQSGAVERVAKDLRRMDFLAQYAPDEFAMILPEANREAIEATLRRIVHQARLGGMNLGGVSVHVGLASCPEDGSQPGELISRARAALRSARIGGGYDGVSAAPKEEAPIADDVVAIDRSMLRVFGLAKKVASAPITVLVLGETGVGKEIVASAIHREGPRAKHPFVTLNCSALPETLLESELFGHERGAFTGADRRKIGYFEAAGSGTVFLDEIGEMPLGVQAKLLRVLEQRVITRVGGTETVQVDARIVCATNRDLEAEVRRDRFREDLFFRLSAFTIVVPPLRDRKPEIIPLARHFARQFALELGQQPPAFGSDTIAVLESYEWPGNVRELRNAVERAVVLQPTGAIEPSALPERILSSSENPVPALTAGAVGNAPAGVRQRVAATERDAVLGALEETNYNQTRAAKLLGISRFALIRLMRKYDIKRPRKR